MNAQILLLIGQLVQLGSAEVPNVVAIISLLRDHTKTFEAMLTEADKTELAEIERLKAQVTLGPPTT